MTYIDKVILYVRTHHKALHAQAAAQRATEGRMWSAPDRQVVAEFYTELANNLKTEVIRDVRSN